MATCPECEFDEIETADYEEGDTFSCPECGKNLVLTGADDVQPTYLIDAALMFCGTRDLLVPGCRLLVRRAEEAGWDLTYVEEADLIHVYPILPGIPEARRAWRRTVDFLHT